MLIPPKFLSAGRCREFADLPREEQERILRERTTRYRVGWLNTMPKPPRYQHLACLYSERGRQQLVVCAKWDDVQELQESPQSSDLKWLFLKDWDGL